MSLPPGWSEASIEDVALVNPPRGTDPPADVPVSFVPMAAVEAGTGQADTSETRLVGELKGKSYRAFEEGDVLFAKITPCMENGKIAVARQLRAGRGFGSTEFHVLRAASGINPNYLLHFVLHERFRRDAARNMKGTAGQLRVPTNYVKEHRIPVPPVAEQERIVAIIEEQFSRLDAGVAALERVRQNLKRMRAAVLRSALTGTLADSDTTRWKRQSLARVVTIASGQTPRGLEVTATGPTPYYKVGDMNFASGTFMAESRAYIDPLVAERFGLHIRPAGTVIFPKRGGAIATNKKRVLSVPSAYDLNTIGLVPGPEIDSRFLHIWISAIDLNTLADGSNVPQINHGDLADLSINLPPRDEQERVVKAADGCLNEIRSLDAIVERALQRCDRLRASVLTSAFAGELAPQHNNDEPASVLLDRIAAERASSNGRTPTHNLRRRTVAA